MNFPNKKYLTDSIIVHHSVPIETDNIEEKPEFHDN